MDQIPSTDSDHVPGPIGPPYEPPPATRVHGVGKERLRIGRACDQCRIKRIKCNGERPCHRCNSHVISCNYNMPYARGRKRPITKPTTIETAENMSQKQQSLPSNVQQQSTWAATRRDGLPSTNDALEEQNLKSGQSSRPSPEPGESDSQGHFVGAASGLAFLLRLQKRLRSTGDVYPTTSIFTLGDAALPEFDELSFMLPSKQEAETLVATYFEIACPTVQYFHRGTVEGWLNELYQKGVLGSSSNAALLIILAHATRYIDPTVASRGTSTSSGILYFQAAERQLNRETGPATLTTVQALLASCFYTLTCTRLSHCWNLFGTTSRLVLALGLHRKSSKFSVYQKTTLNYIKSECEKRVFWSAYILDKYLSAILGRPSVFHDEDIDQEIPKLIDDGYITEDRIDTDAQGPFCTMMGLVMHLKLVRIVSRTLRLLYGIRPIGEHERYQLMRELSDELAAWRQSLPAFLNPDIIDARLLLQLFQRQNHVLSVAYYHAEILIYRPCLFSDFGKETCISRLEIQANVTKCVSAAMLIVDIARRIVDAGQFYAGSWLGFYQVYCAAVVLYTYTFKLTSQDESTWIRYFRAAEQCQSYIANTAVADSLPYRFQVIMEEYRWEVIRQIKRREHSSTSLAIEEGCSSLFSGQELQFTPDEDDSTMLWAPQPGLSEDTVQSFMDYPNFELLYPLLLDLGEGF